MKAARFYGPGDLRVEEVDPPRLEEGEILVENHVTLTCGTDLKMYRRGHPYAKPPLIIGHEFSGVVVEVGPKVKGFKVGMRVAAANSAPCNTCFYCRRNQQNLCENLSETLLGFTAQGAYAEYVKVPARIVRQNTYIIPDHVSFEEAALLEPLACVAHGSQLVKINPGDVVAIIGAGPIGLLHLQMAKLMGPSKLIVSDLSDERLKVAGEMGAGYLVNPRRESQVERVLELTGDMGADVVIEASGHSETWESAVAMTRKGGTTLLFGGCEPGTKVSFDAGHIHYGELTLKGAFHHTPLSVEKAMALISSRLIDASKIITHRMKLREVKEALNLMAEGKAVKVALTP